MKTFSTSAALSALLLGLGLVVSAPRAEAAVVTFDNLPGNNGDTFTSYTESGITVTKLSGAGCVAKAFGNPLPDVYFGRACDSNPVASYKISGSGLLSLNSIDFSANNGALDYQFQGFLNNIAVWNTSSSLAGPNATFVTIAGFNPTAVDYIQMDLTANGTSGNFDNINVSTGGGNVPEPASLALFGVALAGLGALRKRKSV